MRDQSYPGEDPVVLFGDWSHLGDWSTLSDWSSPGVEDAGDAPGTRANYQELRIIFDLETNIRIKMVLVPCKLQHGM